MPLFDLKTSEVPCASTVRLPPRPAPLSALVTSLTRSSIVLLGAVAEPATVTVTGLPPSMVTVNVASTGSEAASTRPRMSGTSLTATIARFAEGAEVSDVSP